jgi:hypothetical protein
MPSSWYVVLAAGMLVLSMRAAPIITTSGAHGPEHVTFACRNGQPSAEEEKNNLLVPCRRQSDSVYGYPGESVRRKEEGDGTGNQPLTF